MHIHRLTDRQWQFWSKNIEVAGSEIDTLSNLRRKDKRINIKKLLNIKNKHININNEEFRIFFETERQKDRKTDRK